MDRLESKVNLLMRERGARQGSHGAAVRRQDLGTMMPKSERPRADDLEVRAAVEALWGAGAEAIARALDVPQERASRPPGARRRAPVPRGRG